MEVRANAATLHKVSVRVGLFPDASHHQLSENAQERSEAHITLLDELLKVNSASPFLPSLHLKRIRSDFNGAPKINFEKDYNR